MFKSHGFISESDKIDEIYKMLRAQKRRALISGIFSWTIRLAIIGAIWFWYEKIVVQWDISFQEKIQSFIVKQMSSMVGPIVWDVVRNNPDLIPGSSPNNSSSNLQINKDNSQPQSTDTTTQHQSHKNIPKVRPVEDLLKDEALMKTATDIYKKNTGQ